MKNPGAAGSEDAYGSQLYKSGGMKDANGLSKPDGTSMMNDPQSMAGSGAAVQDKDLKGVGLDGQVVNAAEKQADGVDDGAGSKDQPQSAMPSSVTGATGSAAAE